ncbi:MAG: RdgB/HAM1 family non-canonical purine NTP pyrophosphatase [Bacilli bacterium]|jgi:XTP/dITP diphosphohydrolase
MNLEIVLATNNAHKVHEYREIFKNLPIVFYSLSDLNIAIDVKESGTNYAENALIKAQAIRKFTALPILSDDSGLEIDSLDNFPGLHSSRFALSSGGNISANKKILKMMENKKDRKASFHCAIVFLLNGDKPLYFEGICPGTILKERYGEGGFGYDPIFYSSEGNIRFGEASEDEKNAFSHRAKASRKLITYLKVKKLI